MKELQQKAELPYSDGQQLHLTDLNESLFTFLSTSYATLQGVGIFEKVYFVVKDKAA